MPRKTTHTIRTEVLIKFPINSVGPIEFETEYLNMEIQYTFLPGAPASGPNYYSGGQPADPHEVELVRTVLLDDANWFTTPSQSQIDDWANQWLESDPGYERACNFAYDDRQSERDV